MKRTTNKGRITRIDQAWTAAHREQAEREAAAASEPRVCLTPTGAALVAAQEPAQVAHNAPQDAPGTGHLQALAVPIRLLSVALLTAAKNDIRAYLCGVYLHAVDGEVRVCSTDGHRMLVSRFVPEGALPAWLEKGVIVSRDQLAQALPLLTKHAGHPRDGSAGVNVAPISGGPSLYIDFAVGAERLRLRSFDGFAGFMIDPVDGQFPDYAKVLSAAGAQLARGEAQPMKAAAIKVEYLRAAGDIGMKLGAGAIHSFNDSDTAAAMFTFDGAPDSVLIVMPMRAGDPVPDGVVKMLGKTGIAGSLAALRAHITRTAKALCSAKGEERKALESKKSSFEERVAHLLKLTTQGPKQLEHREAA